jgi:hypothetical protein
MKQLIEEKTKDIYHLDNYHEVVGTLVNISEEENQTILTFKKEIKIALPFYQECLHELKGRIGERVSLLRTDIPDKPYVLRGD